MFIRSRSSSSTPSYYYFLVSFLLCHPSSSWHQKNIFCLWTYSRYVSVRADRHCLFWTELWQLVAYLFWVLKIIILFKSLNFHKMWLLALNFAFLEQNFWTIRRFSENFLQPEIEARQFSCSPLLSCAQCHWTHQKQTFLSLWHCYNLVLFYWVNCSLNKKVIWCAA